MKIKMGLFAENLQAAEHAARAGRTGHIPSMLEAKLYAGKKLIHGAGHGLDIADKLTTRALEQAFRPGGEAARGLGAAADELYTGLRHSPRMLKATGLAAPLGLLYYTQGTDHLQPMFNEALQEGRQVYANDQEFLKKKLAAATHEKTAQPGMPPPPPWEMFGAQNMGQGMAAAGGMGKSPFLQGLGSLIAGGSPNAAFGMMAGGASKGIGDIIGTGKDVISPTAGTLGYRLNRMLHPVTTRVRADELMATSFFNNLGGEVAKGLVGLLKDMASKAVSGITQAPAHATMLSNLMDGDPILSRADPEELKNVYHTVAKFAPTLATDENAVRSIMRQVATQGTEGIDYATIANIAKAEQAITGQ